MCHEILGAALSDANVLAMLETINLDEIDEAQLVQQKPLQRKSERMHLAEIKGSEQEH